MRVTVTTKGNSIEAQTDLIGSKLRELKSDVLVGLSDVISSQSPLDSGTYAISHKVTAGRGAPSGVKTRNPDAKRMSRDGVAQYPNARQQGFQNMVGEINSIDMDSDVFVISNPMDYAALIEARVTGKKTGGSPPPYASAVREAPRIIQEVAQRIASRNR